MKKLIIMKHVFIFLITVTVFSVVTTMLFGEASIILSGQFGFLMGLIISNNYDKEISKLEEE